MSRINTNVSSLTAQTRLNRTNNDLQTALTRLSTGLRINSGKDDPAGLIASESLRKDITSINKAIGNSQRANQIIGTADSALGQVSSLLNDIRGLVTEAANTGGLSESEIAANQLQVDSSLEAINRISQTTSFQGRKLLDGSLDFQTTAGTNFSRFRELQIDQANLGATGSVSVEVEIQTAATKAQVNVANIPSATAAAAPTGSLTFSFAGTASSGTLTLASGDEIAITAASVGTSFNGLAINITDANTGNTATYNSGTNSIDITIDIAGGDTTADLNTLINGLAQFNSTTSDSAALQAGDTSGYNNVTSGGAAAVNGVITITSDNTGTAANGVTVSIVEAASVGSTPTAAFAGSNIQVTVDNAASTSIADIASAINNLAGYSASVTTSSGSGSYVGASATPPTAATLAGGQTASGGLGNDLVLELSGSKGSEVLSFGAGTSISELVTGINLLSDSTGVTANANGTTLELLSSEYGSNSFVNLRVISEGSGSSPSGTFTSAIGQLTRDTGSDVVASVNGVSALGSGNQVKLNTSTLDFSATVDAGFTGSANFTISGGGALFQLGPDVVSNQQARLGISSVSTATLGGVSGRLYELGSGEAKSLKDNPNQAAQVIDEVIEKVASLRGRLGAFQRTTLESNMVSLNDTLTNLSDAQSSIRDADFAKETANLTRAQVLVQSGTSVLGIANQSAQSVLSLLR